MMANATQNDDGVALLYQPIEAGREFRLLRLQPSPDSSDRLVCELINVTLDAPPDFEALSYVWGDPSTASIVQIEKQSVGITANLDSALRHLRYEDRPRTLWVDALCIAQHDTSERSKHVKYMSDVYAACVKDLLWLGADDSIVIDARQSIAELGSLSEIEQRVSESFRSASDHKHLEALASLFQHPSIWKRVWIMQEVSFAPEVELVAGMATMSWAEVEKFLDTDFYTQRYGIPDAFHAAFSHELSFRTYFGPTILYPFVLAHQRRAIRSGDVSKLGKSLLDVLARFRHADSSDPRDMIYGLLGLSNGEPDINTDYSRPVRDVYIECSRQLIENANNLDLLCQGPWELMGNEDRSIDLPSWCPDYAHPGRSRILFAQRDIYNAGSASLNGQCNWTTSGSILIDGVLIDSLTIIRNEDVLRDYALPRLNPSEKLILSWMPDTLLKKAIAEGNLKLEAFVKDEEEPPSRARPGHEFEDYWRTLMVDSKRRPWRRLQDSDLPSLRTTFESFLNPENNPSDPFESLSVTSDWFLFYSFAAWHDGWYFAVSSKGIYCMVPSAAKSGDCIVVLPGAKVPVLLRPSNEGSLKFLWVGACYAHGFMDGGALESTDATIGNRRFEII